MTMPGVLLFLDFGGGEILIILLAILIVLGPDKIPEFAKKTGQVIRYIRKATDDIKTEINRETDEVQKPFKSAYQSATAFSQNTHRAMKATLDEIEKGKKSTSGDEETPVEVKKEIPIDTKKETPEQ